MYALTDMVRPGAGCRVFVATMALATGVAAEEAPPAPPAPAAISDTSQAPPETCAPHPGNGLSLGIRSGWAFPMGSLDRGQSMRSNVTGALPVWIDAGYRFGERLLAGAYFQWAPAFVSGDVCPKNLSCSANDVRLGLQAHWHFKHLIARGDWARHFDPWIGIGTGYEWITFELTDLRGAKAGETDHGFEFVNAQLGADYVGGSFHIGAFGTFSVAQYIDRSQLTQDGDSGFDIRHPATHFWLIVGARFQYDL